jgi:thymidine phosphorylase
MLILGRLAGSLAEAREKLEAAIISGRAAERFAMMVAALGGPPGLMDNPRAFLAQAPLTRPVVAARTGFVTGVNTRALGLAVVALGGGRTRADQTIDAAVGLTALKGIGEEVRAGEAICIVHARDEAGHAQAEDMLRKAWRIGDTAPPAQAPVIERIG